MILQGIDWLVPKTHPFLDDNAVHVWRAHLDLPEPHLLTLEQTLTADERMHASRFRFLRDRTRFIAARSPLRSILGHYLGREPASLRFRCSPYGKPALAEESASNPIFFIMSHSQGMALYALTRIGAVGVDLEHLSTDIKD